jgi:hypothetical protein
MSQLLENIDNLVEEMGKFSKFKPSRLPGKSTSQRNIQAQTLKTLRSVGMRKQAKNAQAAISK